MSVEQRIRTVLAAMSTVSEAPGCSVVVFDPNGHHESKLPTGDPSSLHDEWAARFRRMSDADEFTLRLLVTAAEHALAAYTHRHPGREVDEYGDPTLATEARCLREYESMCPVEAGVIEAEIHGGDPRRYATWLRNVRVRNNRHPDTGIVRPTGEGRLRKVAELRAQGLGAKRIARELGVAVSTAQDAMRALDQGERAA